MALITGHIVGPEMNLLTEKMEKKDYYFTVVARDEAKNRRFIKGKFEGSDRRDTFPPQLVRISPPPFSTDVRRILRGKLRFSEELDTTFTPKIYLVAETSEIKRRWNKDLVSLEFHAVDTLLPSTVNHLLIMGEICDISKNRNQIIKAYPFTTDSILELIEIKGKVEPPCTAIIIAEREDILALGINLPISGYTIHLSDTSNVNLKALRLRPPMLGKGNIADSIINLKPTPEINLDSYLR